MFWGGVALIVQRLDRFIEHRTDQRGNQGRHEATFAGVQATGHQVRHVPPASSMAACSLARVAGDSSSGLLMAHETVTADTLARRATSLMVRLAIRRLVAGSDGKVLSGKVVMAAHVGCNSAFALRFAGFHCEG